MADAEDIYRRATAFHGQGKPDEAEALYRQILTDHPDHADANHMLGIAACQRGDAEKGIALIAKAIAASPKDAVFHNNLGKALMALERVDDAAASFAQALDLTPDLAEARSNLGVALKCRGDALVAGGQLNDALAAFEEALALRPDFPEAHSNLGNVLRDLERLDDAIAHYRKALAIDPDFVDGHYNLGVALHDAGRLDDAVASYRSAVALKPDYLDALNNMGGSLKDLGNLDEALASYRKVLDIDPQFTPAISNILVTMAFMSGVSGDDILAEAKRAGAIFEAPFTGHWPPRHGNDPDPDRVLRIGYLSPYLTRHSLTPQIEPIFRAHNRQQVSIHVYAHVPRPDEVTARLQGLADHWTFVQGLSDDTVAEQIAEDGIDILVDLMGHWAANRMLVFARRSAPIQVSYLCQGLTTGLTAMDYAIGDPWLNDGGAMQGFATEHVVELPGGFAVTSMARDTPIGPVPSEANGITTFCSFNNPSKITDLSLRLWSRVLVAVPGAWLMIKGKGLNDLDKSALLTGRLEDHGIPAGRVDLRGYVPGPDHLALYNETDIALDTAPFNGGATTVEALWMGVPVVTLIGETINGRYSTSHLNRIGAPELVAHSEDEYCEIAAALAADTDRLRRYRQTFRPAMASSLLDADAHVAELEGAFRGMWKRWCEGLAAGPIR